jgi:cathepsin L
LESAWYLATGKLVELSEQQFASCTDNPQDCGGTGGCEGGTAEVAYATAITFGGVASEAEYPYLSGGGQDYACKFSNITTPPVAHLKSYVQLPSNEATPLLNAVATVGPIAISVDASSW